LGRAGSAAQQSFSHRGPPRPDPRLLRLPRGHASGCRGV